MVRDARTRPEALAAGPLHDLLAAGLPLHRAATHAGLPLGVHHKTLNKYIQRLEHQLGRRLLHRAPTAPYAYTTPTDEGLALIATIAAPGPQTVGSPTERSRPG